MIKQNKLHRYEVWASILLPIFYLVGLIGHAVPATFPLMITLTPYTLLATAVVGYLPYAYAKESKLLLWALATFLVTLFLEILGVKTGLVFGSYAYGDTLGLEFMGVPVLIGINWTLVILGTLTIVERLTKSVPVIMIATALITVVFDFIMEPVAIALDYWAWEGGPIPLQNYVAWGIISFVFAGLFKFMGLTNRRPLPLVILATQTVFFLGLRILVV